MALPNPVTKQFEFTLCITKRAHDLAKTSKTNNQKITGKEYLSKFPMESSERGLRLKELSQRRHYQKTRKGRNI